MATQYIPRLTEEQYLDQDRANPFRSEYIDGEMLAISAAHSGVLPWRSTWPTLSSKN